MFVHNTPLHPWPPPSPKSTPTHALPSFLQGLWYDIDSPISMLPGASLSLISSLSSAGIHSLPDLLNATPDRVRGIISPLLPPSQRAEFLQVCRCPLSLTYWLIDVWARCIPSFPLPRVYAFHALVSVGCSAIAVSLYALQLVVLCTADRTCLCFPWHHPPLCRRSAPFPVSP